MADSETELKPGEYFSPLLNATTSGDFSVQLRLPNCKDWISCDLKTELLRFHKPDGSNAHFGVQLSTSAIPLPNGGRVLDCLISISPFLSVRNALANPVEIRLPGVASIFPLDAGDVLPLDQLDLEYPTIFIRVPGYLESAEVSLSSWEPIVMPLLDALKDGVREPLSLMVDAPSLGWKHGRVFTIRAPFWIVNHLGEGSDIEVGVAPRGTVSRLSLAGQRGKLFDGSPVVYASRFPLILRSGVSDWTKEDELIQGATLTVGDYCVTVRIEEAKGMFEGTRLVHLWPGYVLANLSKLNLAVNVAAPGDVPSNKFEVKNGGLKILHWLPIPGAPDAQNKLPILEQRSLKLAAMSGQGTNLIDLAWSAPVALEDFHKGTLVVLVDDMLMPFPFEDRVKAFLFLRMLLDWNRQ